MTLMNTRQRTMYFQKIDTVSLIDLGGLLSPLSNVGLELSFFSGLVLFSLSKKAFEFCSWVKGYNDVFNFA